jgi:hypothetical protein
MPLGQVIYLETLIIPQRLGSKGFHVNSVSQNRGISDLGMTCHAVAARLFDRVPQRWNWNEYRDRQSYKESLCVMALRINTRSPVMTLCILLRESYFVPRVGVIYFWLQRDDPQYRLPASCSMRSWWVNSVVSCLSITVEGSTW